MDSNQPTSQPGVPVEPIVSPVTPVTPPPAEVSAQTSSVAPTKGSNKMVIMAVVIVFVLVDIILVAYIMMR